MANAITITFVPGFRLPNGTDLQGLVDQINAAISSGTGTALSVSGITVAGFLEQSVANALTAVGTNRATALALTKAINNVTTTGSGTGVVLPSTATVGIGGSVIVFNSDATNAAKVYGAGSDTIDGTAGSTGVTLSNTKRCTYICVAANTFISAQLGVVSA